MPPRAAAASNDRIPVGVWTEWPAGARWANEGMTRLLGFMIEGVATGETFLFKIVLPESIAAEARADFASLKAVEGRDYSIHSPATGTVGEADFEGLARFANRAVDVEGWIVLFPYFRHALLLDAPVATIFPDGIPVVFPVPDQGAWGANGYHVRWRDHVQALLDGSNRVVTFSEHVAHDQAHLIFGVPTAKIRVVPHAAPDLAHLLPFMIDRARTETSRLAAAELLRAHARERGWTTLQDYPFEEASYIAVSTQDRVTKNIRLVAEAVRGLVRDERIDLKLLMTAPLHWGASWTPLPKLLENEQLMGDVVSMTDLPRDVHAAFFHCAAMAVHPSIFEGGLGPFPFYEAVSVGVPCLVADGPHVRELVKQQPALAPFVFDPNDVATLSRLIVETLRSPAAAVGTQEAILASLRCYGWAQVASAYANAAIERGSDVDNRDTRRRGGLK